MGPQLYRCGNCLLSCSISARCAGFNGAATLSLRKLPVELLHLSAMRWLQWGRNFIVAETSPGLSPAGGVMTGFNGAATLSLRKLLSCRQASARKFLLQWGRNFIVAETCMEDGKVTPEELLQWGRNFIVAETLARGRGLTWLSQLQWGRNFIVAETWSGGYSTGGQSGSFNGAATLSLRKLVFMDTMPLLHTSTLQWGRNFIVAETAYSLMGVIVRVMASMGPQLYRCGNYLIESRAKGSTLCFNGAATLSLRKL